MRVDVVFCPGPQVFHIWTLDVPAEATLADALRVARAQWPEGLPDWGAAPSAGVWGRKHGADSPLCEGDRVEVYRELRVDPKVARRERFSKQGARGTGLFARRRPGAKPGY